jgi:hypothetical protein
MTGNEKNLVITRDGSVSQHGVYRVNVTMGAAFRDERRAADLARGEAGRWARELGKTTDGIVSSGAAYKPHESEYHFCFMFR